MVNTLRRDEANVGDYVRCKLPEHAPGVVYLIHGLQSGIDYHVVHPETLKIIVPYAGGFSDWRFVELVKKGDRRNIPKAMFVCERCTKKRADEFEVIPRDELKSIRDNITREGAEETFETAHGRCWLCTSRKDHPKLYPVRAKVSA